MPKPISIEKIKEQLPPFLIIKEETYKGSRYKATFIDTEYNNEEFEAIVSSVIKLQNGCRTRSNDKRKQNSWSKGCSATIPLEIVKERLPNYLEIEDSSYRGVRYSANFYDKEYDIHFSMIVRNILREGTGYCKERKLAEFRNAICITKKDVKERIFKLYGDRVKMIESEGEQTSWRETSEWEIDGKIVKTNLGNLLSGKIFQINLIKRWRAYVLVRDCHICQKCSKSPESQLQAHHIYTWENYIEHRYNIHNGICLCKSCHDEYHRQFKFKESLDNFCQWLDENQKKSQEIRSRLALPIFSPILPDS